MNMKVTKKEYERKLSDDNETKDNSMLFKLDCCNFCIGNYTLSSSIWS